MSKIKPGNESLRKNLTNEMMIEVETVFETLADNEGYLSISKLPLALKSLGMSLSDTEDGKIQADNIEFDKFVETILSCMKQPNWAAHEVQEAFGLFDKDSNGYIDPPELKRVFNRIGENLLETEMEDQLREFDIDGDLQMAVAEYYKMIGSTRGADFLFEDNS